MIIKSIYCSDDRPYATLDAQKYIFNEAKVPIGGTFAYGCAPERWSSSNISTKIIWRKKGRGKYYHIVIGFDPADNVTLDKAVRIGDKIARFFKDRYVAGAVHTNTDNIHIHILISYTTIYGEQKGMTKNWLNDFKSFVSGIAEKEHCLPVRMHSNDWKPISGIHSLDGEDDPEMEIASGECLGKPEEVLFENLPAESTSGTTVGFAPGYERQQRTYINYNFTVNNNYYSPGYTPGKSRGANNYNARRDWNSRRSLPAAAPVTPTEEPGYTFTTEEVSAPVTVIEYCLCINGIATDIYNKPLYKFPDYNSAFQYGMYCKRMGCRERHIGLNENTLRFLCKTGQIPCIKVGNKTLINWNVLMDYLTKGGVRTEQSESEAPVATSVAGGIRKVPTRLKR